MSTPWGTEGLTPSRTPGSSGSTTTQQRTLNAGASGSTGQQQTAQAMGFGLQTPHSRLAATAAASATTPLRPKSSSSVASPHASTAPASALASSQAAAAAQSPLNTLVEHLCTSLVGPRGGALQVPCSFYIALPCGPSSCGGVGVLLLSYSRFPANFFTFSDFCLFNRPTDACSICTAYSCKVTACLVDNYSVLERPKLVVLLLTR